MLCLWLWRIFRNGQLIPYTTSWILSLKNQNSRKQIKVLVLVEKLAIFKKPRNHILYTIHQVKEFWMFLMNSSMGSVNSTISSEPRDTLRSTYFIKIVECRWTSSKFHAVASLLWLPYISYFWPFLSPFEHYEGTFITFAIQIFSNNLACFQAINVFITKNLLFCGLY